jgi:phenylacetic acid degradation operon negative regulatory protein
MSSIAPLLSTIQKVPISYFVYSSLSCFGRRHGGELPGMWFVRALRLAGRDVAAIRQTLYRMEAEGELESRKVGRSKFYRASRMADAVIDAGTDKIFQPPAADWDGRWTMVHVHLSAPGQRVARERVVGLLAVQGFALLGHDTYIHPRNVGPALLDALGAADRPHVVIVHGSLLNEDVIPAVLARWQIPILAERYRRTVARLGRIEARLDATLTPRDAFLLRFAVVFDYLGVAWDDPELPPAVLPTDWPGHQARRMAADLYSTLLDPAQEFASQLLGRSQPTPARRR